MSCIALSPKLLHVCCRLILENLLKYGLRMQFFNYIGASLHGKGNLPLVLAFPALVLFAMIGLCSELLGAYCLRYEQQVRQHGQDL
jgi:hypothetical protein